MNDTALCPIPQTKKKERPHVAPWTQQKPQALCPESAEKKLPRGRIFRLLCHSPRHKCPNVLPSVWPMSVCGISKKKSTARGTDSKLECANNKKKPKEEQNRKQQQCGAPCLVIKMRPMVSMNACVAAPFLSLNHPSSSPQSHEPFYGIPCGCPYTGLRPPRWPVSWCLDR